MIGTRITAGIALAVSLFAALGPQIRLGDIRGGTAGRTVRDNGTAAEWATNLINDGTNVGIGETPDRPLYVDSDDNALAAGSSSILVVGSANKERVEVRGYGATADPTFVGARASGTESAPTATAAGLRLLGLAGMGYDGSAFQTRALNLIISDGAWSGTANGTAFTWEVTDPADTTRTRTERMRLSGKGYLGIGNTNPPVPLTVNGGIALKTRSVTASTSVAADDFTIYAAFDGVTAITVTLPAANLVNGRLVRVQRTDSDPSTSGVSVARLGSDTIMTTSAGVTSANLTAFGKHLFLQSDGTSKWYVVASN